MEKPIGRFESILSDQLGGVLQRVYLITLTEQDLGRHVQAPTPLYV